MTMERAARFGACESLLGIITEPKAKKLPVPCAVLWLNAGMMHHIGPFGWYVTLARRLAASGYLSFRIDLSGVGESPRGPSNQPIQERAAQDVRAAMDFLARTRGIARFVLIGVCSGAIVAHRVAVRDERVVGSVMLDGYAYRTRGYYLRYYGARLMRLGSWRNAARKAARMLFPRMAPRPAPAYLTAEYFLEFPAQDEARADLARLLARKVECLFLYTGGLANLYFNHRRQFREMFGSFGAVGAHLQIDYMAQADHLFSAHAHRQIMFDRVENWLGRFAGHNAAQSKP